MRAAAAAGAVATGFATVEPVREDHLSAFRSWVARGCHGTMDWLALYDNVRRNPALLLPGARTVISMAFPYAPAGGYHHPHIADYALGQDYHTVLRHRLMPLVEMLRSRYGAMSRVCVDTAPILERYWAVQAGVGFIGRNRQLIVPGKGSGVFLCEVLTTHQLPPSQPCTASCEGCGMCVRACPGGALCAGGFDARRCISYLTIEHRGPLPHPVPGERFYGCDVCRRVCPHDAGEPPEPLPEFCPDPLLLSLDSRALRHLTSGDWRRLSAGTARTRLRYRDFLRNLGNEE